MGHLISLFNQTLPFLVKGLGVTLVLTLISIVLGFILGVFLALCKTYGNKLLYLPITGFIELIRGTPLLVQLFILYFGLPPYGIRFSPLAAALIGFSINSGAYQAEYLRGSIISIPSSQMRAARSIGMTRVQGISYIILPQALRKVIPAWTNEFIYLLKYTSLAYIIGAPEMMAQAKFVASRNYEFFKVYLFTAIIYLLIVVFFTQFFKWVEDKVKIPGFEFRH